MKIYEKRVDDVRKLYATEAEFLTENDTDVTGSFNFAGKYYYAPPGKIVDGSGNEISFETTNVRFVPHPVHVKTDDEKVQPKEVLFEDTVKAYDDIGGEIHNLDLTSYDELDITIDGTKYEGLECIEGTASSPVVSLKCFGGFKVDETSPTGVALDFTTIPFGIVTQKSETEIEGETQEVKATYIYIENAAAEGTDYVIKIEG